jgi:hypothetical protein
MELKEYLGVEFEGLERNLTRVTNGLTQQEITWRPASGCNSIGLILVHMVRFEDSFVHARVQGKPEVWTTEKWYEKCNMPEKEDGPHLTVEQVNCYPVPDLKNLMAYHSKVRAETLNYLKSLSPDMFDKKVTLPFFGELTIGRIFSIIIGHLSQHIGEISYIRGIQRGMDK